VTGLTGSAIDEEDVGDRIHDELGRIHAELERGGISVVSVLH
jgi:hypothetical protein